MNPYNEVWYHGTDANFTELQIPPPPKPNEPMLVRHTAMFFTTHIDYAKAAGRRLCITRIHPSSRILDATKPSSEAEALRCEVAKNKLAALSVYVRDRAYWTEGWKSGDTLRFAFDNPMALQMIMANVETLIRAGMSRETAMLVTQHNVTRGLIELICVSAKALGFDAIVGHEIDRHNDNGQVIARPWLAVLNATALAPVEWRTEVEA